MKNLKIIYALIGSLILFYSCTKEYTKPDEVDPNYAITSVAGNVIDENFQSLQDVEVNVHGNIYYTNEDGSYILENIKVPKGRFTISFKKDGYFNVTRSEIPSNGKPSVMPVAMISKTGLYAGQTQFQSSAGGVLNIFTQGCTIIFPADNFVTESGASYTGNVNAAAAYLDPTSDIFNLAVHGGDMRGVDASGGNVIVDSYAGINVELTDDYGNKLDLDPNKKVAASVELQIPPGLLGNSPATIDLWDFGNNNGLREAGGSATKQGDKYIAQMEHFSYWECAIPYSATAIVSGIVKDTYGKAIPGVKVAVGKSFAVTDNNGHFKRAIPAGITIDVTIKPDYYGTFINPVSVGPLSSGQTEFVELIVPPMNIVQGVLVNCQGIPVPGKVVLRWGTEFSSIMTPTGIFELPIPDFVPSAMINAYGNNYSATLSITPDTNPYDVGKIILCPPVPVGTNEIVVDGNVYDEYFEATGYYYYYEYYSGKDSIDSIEVHEGTYVNIYGDDGDIYMDINKAAGPGTYYVGNKSCTGTSISIYIGDLSFCFISGFIQIMRYDNVGGLIEGVFSGTAVADDHEPPLRETKTITGKFSVIREQDQVSFID